MNLVKSPHQILLEEAGALPASPGMVNTAPQMLIQQSGILPQFADGGSVQMSPRDMIAALIANGVDPAILWQILAQTPTSNT